jgi:hypothetical protein
MDGRNHFVAGKIRRGILHTPARHHSAATSQIEVMAHV